MSRLNQIEGNGHVDRGLAPVTDNRATFTRALRELLQRRREGSFISGAEMDARLDRMISRKRRQYLATDAI